MRCWIIRLAVCASLITGTFNGSVGWRTKTTTFSCNKFTNHSFSMHNSCCLSASLSVWASRNTTNTEWKNRTVSSSVITLLCGLHCQWHLWMFTFILAILSTRWEFLTVPGGHCICLALSCIYQSCCCCYIQCCKLQALLNTSFKYLSYLTKQYFFLCTNLSAS